MNDSINGLTLIGSAEKISFVELDVNNVPARIDTGARTSSLWASDINESDGVLSFVLFDSSSKLFTGKKISVSDFSQVVVASSNGLTEKRYKVVLRILLKGRKIKASFTLTDRSSQVYPVLVGRNILRGKFLVDVKIGDILSVEERERYNRLQSEMDKEI